jgi:DNA-binding CsgD family transcriptional regulator/PAS domain-containing protein
MDELVSWIYDAALAPDAWIAVLGAILRKLNGVSAYALSFRPGEPYRFESSVGLEPRYLGSYADYVWSFPELATRLAKARTGEVRITSEMAPSDALLRSALYNEWSRPQGVLYSIAGITWRDEAAGSLVSVLRSPRSGEFTEDEVDWLRRLMPHFVRAAEIRRRLGRLELERAPAAGVLAQLTVGVVVLDARGTVSFANPAAEEILRDGRSVSFGCEGARALLERETLALRALVHSAIATSLGRETHPGGSVSLTRELPRRPLHVTVSPVGRETVTLWGDGQPAAVVILTDPERGPRPVPKELQRLLSLTPTQARLTALLVEGSTVAEAAEQLGILASTARNHLKEALSRAGVRRQSELVALALRSIPPLR